MLAVVARVRGARVEIDGETAGAIGRGFLVLLGVHKDDTEEDARYMADRLCGLRVFEDENGKMNLSPQNAGCPSLLIVSQFTLYGDTRQRRPAFIESARPDTAIPLYEKVIEFCRGEGFTVETGRFGADMQVFSQNDGPVTLLVDSASHTKGAKSHA